MQVSGMYTSCQYQEFNLSGASVVEGVTVFKAQVDDVHIESRVYYFFQT